jgi:hypothetical protein
MIYVDADACPVKEEVYRVAHRHGVKVFVVSNAFIMVPRDPLIERVVVGQGLNAADDWIAERAGPGDVVITADIPLAPVNQSGRGSHRPDRAGLHGGLDRHGARDARPHAGAARDGRGDRRAEALLRA